MGKHWAAEELSGINLGDERLNKRSVKLLESLADKPSVNIPNACNGWAETQAAYRFLAQDGIGWEDILAPHFACTEQRMRAYPVVLCPQDTTELDFNGQAIEGLGPLSYAAQRGMHLPRPMRSARGANHWGARCLDVGTRRRDAESKPGRHQGKPALGRRL